ncbi:MAG: ABC transporter permease [Oscillospiraceae bacterium]|nr:ABC transporter permease [Oscillospiraceae bacterium]
MKNYRRSYLKWGGNVKKLWMIASANIKKHKSVSITLVIMFVVAALLLNAGLLVVLNYGSFFENLKEELNPSDAYFLLPDAIYSEKTERYFNENEHVKKAQHNDALLINCDILSQGKDKGYTVIFRNMDEQLEMTKWKFIGSHLPAEDMAVYLPDVFKAVSGYDLNDKIKLNYKDEQGEEKTLEFTVKGYTEDIFFSSTDTGLLSFYLPEDIYNQVSEILNDPVYKIHLVFTDLDEIASAAKVENSLRELLGLSSASLMAADVSELLVMIDVELVEMSRVMMASMIAVMMVVFAFIIVIVCLLVVRFRIVNSIEEDMIKIGSMKSAGYTSRQIIISLLMQFGLVAALGSLIGIALSYPVLPAVSRVFEQQSGLKWEQGFDAIISSVTFAVILVIVAAVALLAARKVKKLTPIHALRGESSSRKYKNNYLPLEKTSTNLSLRLAFKSTLQNFRQSVMILIIVAAVAFAGSYGIIMYYNTSVDTKAFAEVPGMEICNVMAVLNPQMDHEEIIGEIKNMANVRKAQYLDEVKLKVDGNDVSGYVMDDYAGKESKLVYDGHYPEKSGEIVLAGILAGRLDKKTGDTVTVAFNGNKEEIFTVSGLSNGSSMGGMNTCILAEDFIRLNPDFKPQILDIYLDKGTDAAEFVKILENKYDKELLRSVMDFDKGLAEGMASYQNIVAIMGITMLIITLTVIALVLYFVIGSSVIRRKRELGIQKAVGYTTVQLMNQIAAGFAIPVSLGVIAGSFLGAVYTNPLMSVAMQGMGVMKAGFIINPVWVIIFGAGTFVFAYLLSLAVTWRIRKISAYALVTE